MFCSQHNPEESSCQGYAGSNDTHTCMSLATLSRIEEAALRHGVWGKWCKILPSRHCLALNMMTKNPTFSTKNQAFKKEIEKQNTENRMSYPAI